MALSLQNNLFLGKTVFDTPIANADSQSLNNVSHARSKEVELLNFQRKQTKTFQRR